MEEIFFTSRYIIKIYTTLYHNHNVKPRQKWEIIHVNWRNISSTTIYCVYGHEKIRLYMSQLEE